MDKRVVAGISFAIFVLAVIAASLFLKGEGGWSSMFSGGSAKKPGEELYGTVIQTGSSVTQMALAEVGSGQSVKLKNPRSAEKVGGIEDSVRSLLRSYCRLYSSPERFTSSWEFQDITNQIEEAAKSYKSRDAYLYLEVPRIVSEACKNDPKFVERVIAKIQGISDDAKSTESSAPEMRDLVAGFKFASRPSAESLKDSKTFNAFFYGENRKAIIGYAYPYYLLKNTDIRAFFDGKPFASLDDENDFRRETTLMMEKKLRDFGYVGFKQFADAAIFASGLKSLPGAQKSVMADYESLKKRAKVLGIDLSKEYESAASLEKFFSSGGSAKLLSDPESRTLVTKISNALSVMGFMTGDHPDNMYETWEGKRLF